MNRIKFDKNEVNHFVFVDNDDETYTLHKEYYHDDDINTVITFVCCEYVIVFYLEKDDENDNALIQLLIQEKLDEAFEILMDNFAVLR